MAKLNFSTNGQNIYTPTSGPTDESSTSLLSSDLSNLSGSTSNIQSQINSKGDKNLGTFSNVNLQSIANANLITSGYTPSNIIYVISGQNGTNASSVGAYSTNAITWTPTTFPTTGNWARITYGNGVFVSTHTSSAAASSTDGITWTLRTLPNNMNNTSKFTLTYGNGIFLTIVGNQNSTTGARSTDGITWTTITMPSFSEWRGSYGDGVFVAIAQNTTTAATSTDAITWTTRTLPTNSRWQAVTYGNGLFVAVAGGGIGSTAASISTDAITWTIATLPSSSGWESITYGNGIFVVVGQNVTPAYSTNGITWTISGTPPIAQQWSSINYSNGLFVACGGNFTTAMISTNGITWTSITMPHQQFWQSVATIRLEPPLNIQDFIGQPQQAISSINYTVQPNDKFLTFNTVGNCTITLPPPDTFPNRELVIKQIGAFTVNSSLFNIKPLNSTSRTNNILSGAGKFAVLVSDKENWNIVRAN